jgi:hypothetical protein
MSWLKSCFKVVSGMIWRHLESIMVGKISGDKHLAVRAEREREEVVLC